MADLQGEAISARNAVIRPEIVLAPCCPQRSWLHFASHPNQTGGITEAVTAVVLAFASDGLRARLCQARQGQGMNQKLGNEKRAGRP